MSALDAAVQAARAGGDYNPLLAQLPFCRFVGAEAALVHTQVRVHLPYQPILIGNTFVKALHGGVVGASLELAALLQLIHERGLPLPKTIDFTIDYLRLARTESLYAVADVQRLGRRVANVRMRAYQADEQQPVALGRGHFLLD
ncbi:MAG TPA: PaaI family thioesterase [Polyangiales bacterium]|nr:PaaI family thioesterase [Polyangiales bacterium]